MEAELSRRRFLGYVLAAPTLVAAADLRAATALAATPSAQITDHYDLSDLLTQATMPTAHLIQVQVQPNGRVAFALPRAEVGQGITTAVAMVIADEMGIPLSKVDVTLADARPELVWNQLTGGSNTMHSIYTPVRVAAAIARGRLLDAAKLITEQPPVDLGGLDLGRLTHLAAASKTQRVRAKLKPASQLTLVGTPQKRIDARDAVTGRKVFAMDDHMDGALPTMLCRAPTINGTPLAVRNLAAVEAMPGITHVAIVPHTQYVPGGVAVRGRTFGQCIDAVRALDVQWGPGTADGKSEADVLKDLEAAEVPLTPAPPGTKVLDETFTFHFRPGDPLETNCALADVRADRAEVRACLKSPIWAQEQIATMLGLPVSAVTVRVSQGGGSFGRHLFSDSAFEAVAVSRALGVPVKLMWHRTDNFRQGRVHPMCTSRVRIAYDSRGVVAYDQRHTSVATDFSMGFGELLSATMATLPHANSMGYSQMVFELTQNVPYQFGAVTQLLQEVYEYNTFNTGSVRNIYSPDVATARELMVDRAARALRQDPAAFRLELAKDARMKAVIQAVTKAARWGRRMPAGTAQGLAVHSEYKGRAACVAEIDCRPQTVQRQVRDGYTGPRVTRVFYAVDVGLPINPLGLKAQMMGGIMDGIAQALTYSLHLRDGHFLEGSWDNAYYTRQWNVPPEVDIQIMPANAKQPGGAGEFGVAATMAAVAGAYWRATGRMPTRFPLNHDEPLGFEPLPVVPSIPQSPTDGLAKAY